MSKLSSTVKDLFGNNRSTRRRDLAPRGRLEQLESRIVFSVAGNVIPTALTGPTDVHRAAEMGASDSLLPALPGSHLVTDADLDAVTTNEPQTIAFLGTNELGSEEVDRAFAAITRELPEGDTKLGEIRAGLDPVGEVDANASQFFPWLLLLLEGVIGPEPEFPDPKGDPAETQSDDSGNDTDSSDDHDESGDTGGGTDDTGDGGGGGGEDTGG